NVTGVQTCALPISAEMELKTEDKSPRRSPGSGDSGAGILLPVLQKLDTYSVRHFHRFFGPDGTLYFTDMGFAEEEHAQAGLADTASDGQRKRAVKDTLLEWKARPFFAAALFQLDCEAFRVHTDSHGGKLQRNVKDRIIDDNITVQLPVVVIRSASVVGLAGFQQVSDLHPEYGALLTDVLAFPFLRPQIL